MLPSRQCRVARVARPEIRRYCSWRCGCTPRWRALGSARKLERLCREHDAYRWLCGGVPVDYHLLSDFRREHQEALNDLLTQIVAALMFEDLVSLKEVAQDGLRVRSQRRQRVLSPENPFGRAPCRRLKHKWKRLAHQREQPGPRGNPAGACSTGTGGIGTPAACGACSGSTARRHRLPRSATPNMRGRPGRPG